MEQTQQTNEAPDRVLLAERKGEQRRRLDIVVGIVEAAATLAPLYAELDLGAFDAAALADVYESGGAETSRRYLAHAEAEAAKVSPILRGSILAGIKAAEPGFITKAKEVKRNAATDALYLLGYVEVTPEGATLTEQGAERIKDDARIYTTDPEQIEKHRQHAAAVEALNIFFEDGKAMPSIWINLFDLDPKSGKFSIPAEGVNYAYLLEHAKKKQGEQTDTAPTMQEKTNTDTVPRSEPQQHNRTTGRMVKGIAKAPDTRDRGAELRRGLHKFSPDAPE